MAVYKDNIVNIDLDQGELFRSFANKSIGEGDKDANRYGVNVFRGSEPVDLTNCTVTGYFIRSDETTVIIGGEASGNVATVVLPDTCFAKEGSFSLAIKVTGGTVTGTLRIVDGTVVNTVLGTVVDPGGIVPDIETLMAVIERAEAAAETIGNYIVTEELIEDEDYRLIVDIEE